MTAQEPVPAHPNRDKLYEFAGNKCSPTSERDPDKSRPRVTRWSGDAAALIFGALLPLAFAPFRLFPFSFLCPAALLWLWLNCPPRRAFLRGALFGLGFFGVGVSWVYVSLNVYGQANMWLAAALTLAMIIILTLYIAFNGYLLAGLFPKNNLSKCLLAFPAFWVLFEWLRSWLLSGFPWLLLGYTQLNHPLSHFAPIIGVYGISLLVAFSSATFVVLIKMRKRLSIVLLLLLFLTVLWGSGPLLQSVKWTTAKGPAIPVSLIQGNIPQQIKWDHDQTDEILALYKKLTLQQLENPTATLGQIIVWPEAAVTVMQTEAQDYLMAIADSLKAHHSTVITGIPIQKGERYYNGVLALGNGQGVYLKRHLVPFGEYMPLRPLLRWLKNYVEIPMSDFSSGPRHQPLLIANGIPVATFICYEITYPEEVLDQLPAGQLLITVSDDSWFGRSLAPAQHIEMAQMRALETGRYLLMSTNNAITAIISPTGQPLAFAPPFQEFVLSGKIQAMVGSTPWVTIGIYPVLLLLLLLLVVAFIYQFPKKKSALCQRDGVVE